MKVSLEQLDYLQIECSPDGHCELCDASDVVTIELTQNTPSKAGAPCPWACLECCQRIHETLTAALSAVQD